MDKDKLTKLVAEKVDAACKASTHPKKFFITENGRGVVDGGDLYNAVLKDVLDVVKVALVDILDETLKVPEVPKVETKVESKVESKGAPSKSSAKDKKK